MNQQGSHTIPWTPKVNISFDALYDLCTPFDIYTRMKKYLIEVDNNQDSESMRSYRAHVCDFIRNYEAWQKRQWGRVW